jgi:hypothetical protein
MLLPFMTSIAKAFMKERPSDKKDFWKNELKSLGIEPKRENELNDKAELEALAEIIKQVYYQEYKTAYGDSSKNNNNNNNPKS